MLAILLQGAAIGLSAAGAPGPLQAYLISQTLAGGAKRGAPIAFAPLITDAFLVPVILFALHQIPPVFLQFIRLAGAALLLYLAIDLWHRLRQPSATAEAAALPPAGGLRTAVLMNFLSPGPYLFWSLVNGPILLGAWAVAPAHGLGFLFAFYGVFISGMLLLVVIFHQALRLGPSVVRALQWLSLLILVIFAALLILNFFFALV